MQHLDPNCVNVTNAPVVYPTLGESGTQHVNASSVPVAERPFVVKDSGERVGYDGGMVRDTQEGKIDYTLLLDGPMLERWAVHLTKGAEKYAKRNWLLGRGDEVKNRFRESAMRHFIQWMHGDKDEDHAAAVYFNINGYEYVK